MTLPAIIDAQAAIEAGMIAAGWRIKHREPWPRLFGWLRRRA